MGVYDIPLVPRINIPETFGRALSYEGQIHALCKRFDDITDSYNTTLKYINDSFPWRFADPINWDADNSYEPYTVVYDPQSGSSYVSIKSVPTGTPLTDTSYWVKISDFNAQLASFQNRFRYMPEDFGALGDGVTDDTVAIQACVNAAVADPTNNSILFSQEKYLITSPITVTGRCIFYSEAVQEFTPCIYAGFAGTMFNIVGAGVCFTNLCFRPLDDYRFSVTCLKYTLETNVDTWVRNCKFFYMYRCIDSQGRSIVLEYNNFSNSAESIVIHNSSSNDTARSYVMNGNRFHSYGKYSENNVTGSCIIFDFPYPYRLNEVFITNNYIDRSTSTGAFIKGDWITGMISNNEVSLCGGTFIDLKRVNKTVYSGEQLTICNNSITYRQTVNPDHGIKLEGVSFANIYGNSISNITRSYVYLKDCDRITVNGNFNATNSDYHPIYFVEHVNCDRVVIVDNIQEYPYTSDRFLSYISYSSGSTRTVIENNYLYCNRISNEVQRYTEDYSARSFINVNVSQGGTVEGFNFRPIVMYAIVDGQFIPLYRTGTNYRSAQVMLSISTSIYIVVNTSGGTLTVNACYTYNTDDHTKIEDKTITSFVIED